MFILYVKLDIDLGPHTMFPGHIKRTEQVWKMACNIMQ